MCPCSSPKLEFTSLNYKDFSKHKSSKYTVLLEQREWVVYFYLFDCARFLPCTMSNVFLFDFYHQRPDISNSLGEADPRFFHRTQPKWATAPMQAL
jgi:hypothetical protein